jgi:hypothetical protein
MTNVSDNEMGKNEIKSFENKLVEILDSRSKRVLPITSTISDNAQLLSSINELTSELRRVRYQANPRTYPSNPASEIGKFFGIDSNSNFHIFDAPEAVGEVITKGLTELIENIPNGASPSISGCLLPKDAELEKREKEVFNAYGLEHNEREVDRWFADFFGPKTRTVRTRWQRFFFVAYLEKEIGKS